jgi:uroporphyrin-III C-methyltransferase
MRAQAPCKPHMTMLLKLDMIKVFLIGAGPGDPELLTLKALRLIQTADVILHDSLVDQRILDLVGQHPRLIDAGKRCGRKSTKQTTISALLVAEALAGNIVVRLKGGDPMVFGRATEEMEALGAAGIPYEIIPGVTAATAAAAALKISLTKRGIARSVHFLTGHGAEGGLPAHDWVALTKSGGTLVVYMGGETLAGLAAHFIEAGMSPAMPAIAVESASLPVQRVTRGTIATLPALAEPAKAGGPILVLIGEALRNAGSAGEILCAISEEV